ncbi:biliverdin-producing heme oxygenase [Acetobacter conturbans]|uniref:Heme oxygenase n=1 Tax=Acetobacter conturbans TaxID=1737472 RepID=A0ABX0JYT7_9PROT|nr:biliverdin-producing heme oxygenase [Acetobacter conturbans]NHN88559.1 heme oxygenase [Acetobacter conturbans]
MQAYDTFREHLRSATRSRHAALDQLIGPITTEQAYHRYLCGIAAFRISVEPRLSDIVVWPDILGTWRPTRLAEYLHTDLDVLGLAIDSPLSRLDVSNTSSLLGILYVLEGSVLGARFLVRQVAAAGVEEHSGARHLSLQASSVDNWKHFLTCLEKAEDFDRVLAAQAACDTFDEATDAMRLTDLKGPFHDVRP